MVGWRRRKRRRMPTVWLGAVFTVVIGPLHPMMRGVRRTWPRQPRIYTADHCRQVLASYPRGAEAFDMIDANPVMQSDVCRLAVLCAVGGTYVDTDVEYVRDFTRILSKRELLVVADATGPEVAGTFFLHAHRGQRCVCAAAKGAITNVIEIQGRVNYTKDPHVYHNVAGPWHVDNHVRFCIRPPYPRIEPYWVRHRVASHTWKDSPGYFSWAKHRMVGAGWTTMYEH